MYAPCVLFYKLKANDCAAAWTNRSSFLGFCERQNLSPFFNGTNKRLDEATLIQYAMYEWDTHKNKYEAIKLKLAAVRSAYGLP